MYITSEDFQDGHHFSADFTCDGAGEHPELHIHELPPDTKSVALIVEDPDAPGGTFTHWLLWNIPPVHPLIIPREGHPDGAVQGMNGEQRLGWLPACPPEGHGDHHYHFKAYALNRMLDLPQHVSREQLHSALEPYVIGKAELVAKYAR